MDNDDKYDNDDNDGDNDEEGNGIIAHCRAMPRMASMRMVTTATTGI